MSWFSTSNLQTGRKYIFIAWGYPVCGTLLWKPWWMNTEYITPADILYILHSFCVYCLSSWCWDLPDKFISWWRIRLQCRRPGFNSWVGKIRLRRDRLPIPVFLGFPCGSAGKESARNVGDLGLIPGLERSPGEGKGYPLQCSGLENSMNCIVHGVTKSGTQLSDFHFHFPDAVT